MTLRWKTVLFASASFVMFNASVAHAICILQGTDGNDYLHAPNDGCEYAILGKGGNDNMAGNSLAGCLFPGTNGPSPGVDIMSGAALAPDFYIWDASATPPDEATGDIITNFDQSKGDGIFLGGPCLYEHVTCTFIGGAPFHGIAGEVRFKPAAITGSGSQIQADFDGDGHADFVINLTNGAPVTTGISFTFPDCPP